jgi:hypothetical protein
VRAMTEVLLGARGKRTFLPIRSNSMWLGSMNVTNAGWHRQCHGILELTLRTTRKKADTTCIKESVTATKTTQIRAPTLGKLERILARCMEPVYHSSVHYDHSADGEGVVFLMGWDWGHLVLRPLFGLLYHRWWCLLNSRWNANW